MFQALGGANAPPQMEPVLGNGDKFRCACRKGQFTTLMCVCLWKHVWRHIETRTHPSMGDVVGHEFVPQHALGPLYRGITQIYSIIYCTT